MWGWSRYVDQTLTCISNSMEHLTIKNHLLSLILCMVLHCFSLHHTLSLFLVSFYDALSWYLCSLPYPPLLSYCNRCLSVSVRLSEREREIFEFRHQAWEWDLRVPGFHLAGCTKNKWPAVATLLPITKSVLAFGKFGLLWFGFILSYWLRGPQRTVFPNNYKSTACPSFCAFCFND